MKIKYPNPSLNTQSKQLNPRKSQGMLFEHTLNLANEYYLNKGIALIYKKPTPVQIVRVDYPSRNKARIVEAYYQTPSTTDYNGIYKGRYIDYEAKETNNLTFSFKHIFEHQINHLRKVKEHGGIAFIIILFKKVQEAYILDILDFYKLLVLAKEGGSQSISLTQFREYGRLAPLGYTPAIDYLKSVDELYKI